MTVAVRRRYCGSASWRRRSVGSPEDLAIAVYQGRLPRLTLLDLAPVTLAAAHDGDAVAVGIVDRLAEEAAGMAVALLRRLRLVRADADVVLGGGMLQAASSLVYDGIAGRVRAAAPAASVVVLDVPPVAGTLDEALVRASAGARGPASGPRVLLLDEGGTPMSDALRALRTGVSDAAIKMRSIKIDGKKLRKDAVAGSGAGR